MTKNWKQEMDLDAELNSAEKEIFIEKITSAGVPSVEEYAEEQGKDRNEVEHEYYDKYGEEIRTARDTATEEAPTKYGYKGYRPYGAGQMFILDKYVEDGVKNITENIIKSGLGKFKVIDDKNAVLVLPTIEVEFVKE